MEVFDIIMLERLFICNERINIISCDIDQFNITRLCIKNSNITILPEELFSLPNLISIHLCGNNIEYIPKEICKLTKLKEIFVSGNKIKKIPVEIASLKYLNVLWLNFMEIKYFPEDILSLQLCEIFIRTLPLNFMVAAKNFTRIVISQYNFHENIPIRWVYNV